MSRSLTVKRGGHTPLGWLPPKGQAWTGFCAQAGARDIASGQELGTDRSHGQCRGAFLWPKGLFRCQCPCHAGDEPARDIDSEIKQARLQRALASGRSLVEVDRVTGRRTKTHCKHNHLMDEANTGPGNVCRSCKREASQRVKDKRAVAAAKAAGGDPNG